MRYLDVWLDNASVGCGWRRALDISGPRMKDVLLLFPATLTQIRVNAAELRRAKELELSSRQARRLRAQLKRGLKSHKRHGLRAPETVVKTTIEALEKL